MKNTDARPYRSVTWFCGDRDRRSPQLFIIQIKRVTAGGAGAVTLLKEEKRDSGLADGVAEALAEAIVFSGEVIGPLAEGAVDAVGTAVESALEAAGKSLEAVGDYVGEMIGNLFN
ncbi:MULTISPECIES: hypothetical protein [Paenibacillus]|uniref:hypothetical protein n=1 Tax=Paenibacillus TaxID=44249 RepID=UPI0022B92FAC|nr:hypothetical protein [Paenibacillus caseinilyticus]MCZ8520362.1 hypothetical protein [Paenibacillus caseinilyticus]